MRKAITVLIRFYQVLISSWMGERCRFYPSCSEYCAICVSRYGVLTGLWYGLKRMIKCHPGHPGGVNWPP